MAGSSIPYFKGLRMTELNRVVRFENVYGAKLTDLFTSTVHANRLISNHARRRQQRYAGLRDESPETRGW